VSVALPLDGPDAPPRSNGELVFAEPWQSRAFGMAVTLHEAGRFTWDEFRSALVSRIAAAENAPGGGNRGYYHHWLAALEDTLDDARIVSAHDVSERSRVLAHRPSGHDH
jgi:nitrile hydratase accessory protein